LGDFDAWGRKVGGFAEEDGVGAFEKKLTKDYVYTQNRKAADRKVLSVVDASRGVYK
jgi:hypothetical protein